MNSGKEWEIEFTSSRMWSSVTGWVTAVSKDCSARNIRDQTVVLNCWAIEMTQRSFRISETAQPRTQLHTSGHFIVHQHCCDSLKPGREKSVMETSNEMYCWSNLITVQQDATYSVYYISAGSSTCFGCWHPSSGARTTVITASGIG